MMDKRQKILDDPEAYRQEQITKRLPEDFEELPEEEQQVIMDTLEGVVASIDPFALREEILQIGRLIDQAKILEQREVESKLVKLKEVITEQGVFRDPKMKLLVFTESKETLDYLVGRLETAMLSEHACTLNVSFAKNARLWWQLRQLEKGLTSSSAGL
jgi:ERCC4-related helicase